MGHRFNVYKLQIQNSKKLMTMKLDSKVLMAIILVLAAMGYYWTVFGSNIIFGDEGFYAAQGRWIAEHGIYPIYDGVHGSDVAHLLMDKPPMHILFNTALWSLGGEFLIKAFMPIFVLISAFFIYLIFREYKQDVIGLVAATIFLMINAVITYGVLNYVESLLVMLFTISIYFGMRALRDSSNIAGIISGVFAGFAIMTDLSGIFAPAILILAWFFSQRPKTLKLLGTIMGVILLVSGPFFIRNLVYYGGLCYHVPVLDLAGALRQPGRYR